jgi:hypothetical protein
MSAPEFRALDNFVTEEKCKEDRDANIRNEETLGIPMTREEYSVTINKDENNCPAETPEREVRLKSVVVSKFSAIKALNAVTPP